MEGTRSKILVLGKDKPEDGAANLLAKVFRTKSGDTVEHAEENVWLITTKYYTCEVEVHWIEFIPGFIDDEIKELAPVEAILYEFRDEEGIKDYLEAVETAQDKVTADTGILFYNAPEGQELKDKTFKKIQHLQEEYFLEFIQEDFDKVSSALATESPSEQKSLISGMLEENKTGIERIIESLLCLMWSTMQKTTETH